MLKRTAAVILAAVICLAFAACAGTKVEEGPQLAHNVARIWFPAERVSRFVLDGKLIEGEATGRAYMDPSADGRTSIAWVDASPYFVSETGVGPMGSGIDTGIVSFDGKYALYFAEGELRMMSAETHEYTVIESGLAAVQQIAVSPESKAVMFTATYENDGVNRRTMLYMGGEPEPVFEGRSVMAIAVSDDGELRWFFDLDRGAFCVYNAGEEREVSANCDSGTNYNFTNDLGEVAFKDKDGMNYWYRLSDGAKRELGAGFDYTLKTDIYSMSTTTLIAYINDVKSFTNGLWLVRSNVEGNYLYAVGRLDAEGELKLLMEYASDYRVVGSRIVWLKSGRLSSTDMRGKTKELASDVTRFTVSDDGAYTYYLSNAGSLFGVKGTGKPKKLDTNVSELAEIGGTLYYIANAQKYGEETCGALRSLHGLEAGQDELPYAVSIDKRCGQLMVYAYPAAEGTGEIQLTSDGGSTACCVYFTADGAELKLLGSGVQRD